MDKNKAVDTDMQSQDLLAHINAMLPTFSKGQLAIARYITENYDKAAFMTASKLGGVVGVSESTVVRFSTELGFDGYPKLQRALQELIRTKLTSVQRIEVTTNRIGDKDILRNVINSDIEKLRITLGEINREDFDRIVDAILSARRIYILGVRSASALAVFLSFYFNMMLDNVRLLSSMGVSEIFEQMMSVSPEDVVIGISFPRYSKRTIRGLSFAKERGAKVIAITDSNISPITKIAHYSLIARSDMASFVDSLVAPLSVINALIAAVGMRRKDETYAKFQTLENIWVENGVYERYDQSDAKGEAD